MEEADTLSHQIAIMVDGKIRCIGTPSMLKQLYGFGSELQIVLEKDSSIESHKRKISGHEVDLQARVKKLNLFLGKKIHGIQVVNVFDNIINYVIPTGDVLLESKVNLSGIFRLIKKNEAKYFIKDWSIRQGS